MRTIVLGCLVFLVSGCSSCGNRPMVVLEEREAIANNALAYRMFPLLVNERGPTNTAFSPTSAMLALSMAYNGARGETASEMAKVLGGAGVEALNKNNRRVTQFLNSSSQGIEIVGANSAWFDDGYAPLSAFRSTCEEYYGAECITLDLQSSGALGRINAWANEHTKGMIKQGIDRLPDNTACVLANTVYFKGEWNEAFDKDDTRNHPFHLENGDEKTVRMMWKRDKELPFAFTDDFSAVELAYGDDKRMSMYVFLPAKGQKLSTFVRTFSMNSFTECKKLFHKQDKPLGLPKFRFESSGSLRPALEELGMRTAFDGKKADFAGATDAQVWLDDVVQAAVVNVDEEGTEAAAVTFVEAKAAARMEEFVCERPFCFLIVDNPSGLILFMGAIYEP